MPAGNARRPREPLGDPPEDADLHAEEDGRQLSASIPDTVGAARRETARRLRAAGIETPDLDARFLIEGIARDQDRDSILDERQRAELAHVIRRRLAGEPVWRILGEREFWGLPFSLSAATLEPRPDSETLIETSLAWLGPRRSSPLSILDLGTGTGCLLIALLSECPLAQGLGVDASEAACATARANALRNGVADRSRFVVADWAGPLAAKFDLILSNPPYIPQRELARLAPSVRDYDPVRALDGGADGLDPYRRLASQIPLILAEGGLLVLEIGAGQEADVVAILAREGLVHRGSRADLGGHPRAICFTLA
ncbi:peptide chain release factor N(5)-glutamine methyltransferase [Bosea sp. Leaf344]|uniref:peptide chain release factor N(5)-glutamine methyltransferase n=1 Tax=Bosea sp. Leaf344 TaxID=1736346 RepID=UPI001FCD3876|nr:peptide chain release factor N(5)-glutamine methyltransferase [Bosea sp. Leaf344]